MNPAPYCKILGSNISVFNEEEVVSFMKDSLAQNQGGYICVSNVHTTVTGLEDPAFQKITNNALLATADGMPLLWASKILRPQIRGRASGPDIMARFFAADTKRQHVHFLFGSTPAVLEQLKLKIGKKWPGTQIAGSFSPPFKNFIDAESALDADDQKHIKLIENSKAQVVWVGLGAPKQEQWMAKISPHLPRPVFIGVGAAFDFLAENKPRAPQWMQKYGLEWAHRLSSEPRRLFSRYAKTNSIFIFKISQEILRKKLPR